LKVEEHLYFVLLIYNIMCVLLLFKLFHGCWLISPNRLKISSGQELSSVPFILPIVWNTMLKTEDTFRKKRVDTEEERESPGK
jgi:hypothetical protein